MTFSDRVKNAVQAFTKTENSMGRDASNFLRYGNRNAPMLQDWSQVEMSDQDMYTGYSYAAIKKRANRATALGKHYLLTEGSQSVMDAAKKAEKELEHPYITLIRESKEFTQRKFWHDISTYLDLEGVYYLMAVRAIGTNRDGTTKVGKVQKFVMLNPYQVRRVRNQSTGEIGGYVEARDGMYREIPKEQIIEIRLLNPFDQEEAFSMTDAAKESQFTMKQAGDYTRSSIKGNINSPGIITTDVILDDNIFENFVARVKGHGKGEPLFGNGTGSMKWESMQIDLDKAGLDKINEINRAILFSVAGVSKTAMGIEESGTGREVSKTQRDDFTENAVMPQVEDIIDALNLDYRRWYPEWEKDRYEIVLDNPLESDREAEFKDIEIREKEKDLAQSLVDMGYERELAVKYAHGDISLLELGEPTLEPELTDEEADAAVANEDIEQPAPDDSSEEPGNQLEGQEVQNRFLARNAAGKRRKFVPKDANQKKLEEARKRRADALAAERENTSKELAEALAFTQPETPLEQFDNAVSVRAANQVAARDFPDLYDGLDIDMDDLGCIMMDVEKIPVAQYVPDAEADLFHETSYDQAALVGEIKPHVTLLFGLLENGNLWKDKVDTLLKGWKLDTVTIEKVSFFDLGESYVVIGLVKPTPELIDGHERLTLLPHINTFSEYHPHISLAYITKDADVDRWVKALNRVYKGQKVRTKGLNYGDLPKDDDDQADNGLDDDDKHRAEPAPEIVPNTPANSSPELTTASLSHDCDEHGSLPNSTMEFAQNALEPELRDQVGLSETNLLQAVQKLEGDIAQAVIKAIQAGDIREAERLIAEAEEDGYIAQLAVVLAGFFTVLFPIYAAQLLAARVSAYGVQAAFEMNAAVKRYIEDSARKAAESHVRTVLRDLQKAYEQSVADVTDTQLVELIAARVAEQDQSILVKLPKNPNREDIVQKIADGAFRDHEIYAEARRLAEAGAGREEIIRAIRRSYANISKTRANTIARHETNRVFNMSQYQADLQFLEQSGYAANAYKRLRSRTGEPCAICNAIIHRGLIPFAQNFVDLGDELSATYKKPNGKTAVQKMAFTYEAIAAGNVHVNCNCEYELVIKRDDGTFLSSLDFRVTGTLSQDQFLTATAKYANRGEKTNHGAGLYLTPAKDGEPRVGLSPNANILTINKPVSELFSEDTSYGDPSLITDKYSRQGYDGIQIGDEIVLFDERQLMTEDELTDLYLNRLAKNFNPYQPRDGDGKWTDTPGGGSSSKKKPAKKAGSTGFQSEADIYAYEEKYAGAVSLEEGHAVLSYKFHPAKFNRAARDDKFLKDAPAGLKKETEESMALLDSAVSKGKLQDDLVLFRGSRAGQFFDNPDDMKVGALLTDGGFLSTSLHDKMAEAHFADDFLFEINAPAGSTGLVTNGNTTVKEWGASKDGEKTATESLGSESAYEHEVILPRGSVFEITGLSEREIQNTDDDGEPINGTHTVQVVTMNYIGVAS